MWCKETPQYLLSSEWAASSASCVCSSSCSQVCTSISDLDYFADQSNPHWHVKWYNTHCPLWDRELSSACSGLLRPGIWFHGDHCKAVTRKHCHSICKGECVLPGYELWEGLLSGPRAGDETLQKKMPGWNVMLSPSLFWLKQIFTCFSHVFSRVWI